ncbi:MAG: hypothetical protein ACXVC7_17010 [Bacteroidia bacterium]
MKNEKLDQLLKQKQDIEEQIKLIEQEPLNKKWEPVGGEYTIDAEGDVFYGEPSHDYSFFGTERQTKEQAEKARDKMRVFNRLLAYHDEFCPDFEFVAGDENYIVHFDNMYKTYMYFQCIEKEYIGLVYFPKNIAKELVEKLNSGEVEL